MRLTVGFTPPKKEEIYSVGFTPKNSGTSRICQLGNSWNNALRKNAYKSPLASLHRILHYESVTNVGLVIPLQTPTPSPYGVVEPE